MDRAQLEQHAATVHSVNAEGLERLMLLVEQAGWLSSQSQSQSSAKATNNDDAGAASGDESESNAVPVARTGGIPPATVSERHAYKYRCPQCSLAFKTLEKLQLHSQYHVIRDATKCPLCGRSFRSILSLQKHLESSHAELTDDEAINLISAITRAHRFTGTVFTPTDVRDNRRSSSTRQIETMGNPNAIAMVQTTA